ncbi:MAG: hypothetical protein FJ276_01300 [Planctomycetes bacterium]|nr:hypothetical protein [Planctomycetota bacterium]
MNALAGLTMFFGPPSALVLSIVAVLVDKPKGFAIAGLAVSVLTCLLLGGLIVTMMFLAGR